MFSKTLRKLYASIKKRYYLLSSSGCSLGSSYGVRFLFDWAHSIDKKVANKLYEDEQISLFEDLLKSIRPDYFFDIGAHTGLYSLIAHKASPNTEIHSFEPDKQNLSQLYANLYLNGWYYDINVHHMAISDKKGNTFLDRSDQTSRGTRKLTGQGHYPIKIDRFDNLFNHDHKIAFFKIDVEGHEVEVILGAIEYLSKNLSMLLIESSGSNYAEITKILKGLDYVKFENKNLQDHIFLSKKINISK